MQRAQTGGDLVIDPRKLPAELPGRHPKHARAKRRKLDQRIRRHHANSLVFPDSRNKALDICVSRFVFPGINHMNVVEVKRLSQIARHAVGVKHQDDGAARVSAVAAEAVHQLLARRLKILLRQRVQLVPCKEEVVAVDDQMLPAGRRRQTRLRRRRRAWSAVRQTRLRFAEGAAHNGLQLGVIQVKASPGGW